MPPDVYVDNTPADFLKGRDAQIEKAVEVLKADLAARSRRRRSSRSGVRACEKLVRSVRL